MLEKLIQFLKNLFCSEEKVEAIEAPLNESSKIRIALVPGHSDESSGAIAVNGMSEFFFWNKEIDNLIETYSGDIFEFKKFIREGSALIEIENTYDRAEEWKADALIEFHFNAYNSQVEGAETLTSFDKQDILFATCIHQSICRSLGHSGLSRGVKRKNKKDRGGRSTNAFTGPNCLVEPFFGDTETDFRNFELRIGPFREAIVRGLREYFNV